MPTQPTKVKSVWEGNKNADASRQFAMSTPLLTAGETPSRVSAPCTHLVVYELGGVLQDHLLLPQWRVAGGQGQAAKGVAPGAPLLDHGQDVVLDGAGQGHAGGAHADVGAAVDDALRSTLKTQERMQLMK